MQQSSVNFASTLLALSEELNIDLVNFFEGKMLNVDKLTSFLQEHDLLSEYKKEQVR